MYPPNRSSNGFSKWASVNFENPFPSKRITGQVPGSIFRAWKYSNSRIRDSNSSLSIARLLDPVAHHELTVGPECHVIEQVEPLRESRSDQRLRRGEQPDLGHPVLPRALGVPRQAVGKLRAEVVPGDTRPMRPPELDQFFPQFTGGVGVLHGHGPARRQGLGDELGLAAGRPPVVAEQVLADQDVSPGQVPAVERALPAGLQAHQDRQVGHSSYLSRNFGLMALKLSRPPMSSSYSSTCGRSTTPSRWTFGLSTLVPSARATSSSTAS